MSDDQTNRPMPPHRPMTDSTEEWNTYLSEWQRYVSEWSTYWEGRDGHPGTEDRPEGWESYSDAWHSHWRMLEQPWRTDPEINEERQAHLRVQLDTQPDIVQGRYPFKDIKLRRADVEWLIKLLDDSPTEDRITTDDQHAGLDLRGAQLRGIDLSRLPLRNVRFGLSRAEWQASGPIQRELAAAHLENASLRDADLRGAMLCGVHLEFADIFRARLENSMLIGAFLRRVDLRRTYLRNADLTKAHLEGALLGGARLELATLNDANLQRADLSRTTLRGASFIRAHLDRALLRNADIEAADLRYARVIHADLSEANIAFADLGNAHLGWAILSRATAEHTDFSESRLSQADMSDMNAEGANFRGAQAQNADLRQAQLTKADLTNCDLFSADFREANLASANLSHACLAGSNLRKANLREAILDHAIVEDANMREVTAQGARMESAKLSTSHLDMAHLEETVFQRAHLEGCELESAFLAGCDLRMAYLDPATSLARVSLTDREHGPALLADVHWNGTNLAVLDWDSVKVLGDERRAAQLRKSHQRPDLSHLASASDQAAVRAYHQLAIVLQEQGLFELAGRYAYRGHYLQRRVSWDQRKFGSVVLSLILDRLAGYGYIWRRTLSLYIFVIIGFMVLYLLSSPEIAGHHLSGWDDVRAAFVLSVSSFHGRGFFPASITLDTSAALCAAFEAMIGLVIEISFIATFTRRFFGR